MSIEPLFHKALPEMTLPSGRKVALGKELLLITGPCVIESRDHTLFMAHKIGAIMEQLDLPWVFKASFDKANRSSIDSFRGVRREEGLEILQQVKDEVGCAVTTDIHHPSDAKSAAQVCSILQIPAFLCRQTDLLMAAAQTKCWINVKKGQFLAPWDCKPLVEKLQAAGADKIILTERGTTFGYNNLVCDLRSIPIMQSLHLPVCFDASHSVQLPGGEGKSSGGTREYIPHLTRAALAAGADLLFIECHHAPQEALSDAKTVWPLEHLLPLVQEAQAIFNLIRSKE